MLTPKAFPQYLESCGAARRTVTSSPIAHTFVAPPAARGIVRRSFQSRGSAMGSASSTGFFHPLPVIGHPEAWYQRHIDQAEKSGDVHARASFKVGLHVTAGLEPKMLWDGKMRHFRHALKHYCAPPGDADESVKAFYQKLCDLTR